MTNGPTGKERPDVMLALFSDGGVHRIDERLVSRIGTEPLPLRPNILSPSIVPWQEIDMVSEAAKKLPTPDVFSRSDAKAEDKLRFSLKDNSDTSKEIAGDVSEDAFREYCHLLRRRRSAQAMDGRATMPLEIFHAILKATMPERAKPGLPWRLQVNPVLFVHRVEEMDRGLYIFLRDERAKEDLRGAMDPDFFWERPSRTLPGLELYQLAQGDARLAAKESSCGQDIASDGCFAVAMISRFEDPIEEYGPWGQTHLPATKRIKWVPGELAF
jgi:hypothetical protein